MRDRLVERQVSLYTPSPIRGEGDAIKDVIGPIEKRSVSRLND